MRYKDCRGWLFEVRQGTTCWPLWTIYSFNPEKDKWWPWPCVSWCATKKEAERQLLREAKRRGWQKAV